MEEADVSYPDLGVEVVVLLYDAGNLASDLDHQEEGCEGMVVSNLDRKMAEELVDAG